MEKRVIVGSLIALFGGLSSLVLLSISPRDATDQFGFVLLGLLAYVGVQFVPRRYLRLGTPVAYLLVVLMLLFTVTLGHTAKGAQRWVSLGPVRVQVSELAKPVLALTLVLFVTRQGIASHRQIFLYLLLTGAVVVPVLIQPDLGSSLVLLAISGSILFFSLKEKRMLLPWLVLGILLSSIVWNVGLYEYQKQRIYSFVGQGEASGERYNAVQALLTVGSGKLMGRGIGHGVQSNLRFLPEHHTDFFFASLAEEIGFIGMCLLFALYGALFGVLALRVLELSAYDQTFRFGLISGMFFQFAVHAMMNMGLSPVTGIPLPFLSSGGSAFVSLSLFVGLAMKLDRARTDRTFDQVGFSRELLVPTLLPQRERHIGF